MTTECTPWTDNIILLSDSYKISHWKQYPPGTEYVYSYFESRGCDRKGWDSVCFFGLQYFMKRYMLGQVVTPEKIKEAEEVYAIHFGDGVNENREMFYKEGWQYIVEKHGGRLPIKIKAVPEGMVIPNKTVLFTMVNTDPKCYWLTNFLETLLVQVWYPMTVCTNSRMQKMSIHKYLEETGNTDWAIPGGTTFKLHDFGFRGVSSIESAASGGCGHLVNFLGTDTVASMVCARTYYGAGIASGHSIPASEHSTITSWGVEGEVDAMRNMLEQYPTGLVACVSDSFNIWKACSEYWGSQLKDLIKSRCADGKFGRLVVRPDSGDPAETCTKICGLLCDAFAEDVTTTSTGHKLLPPYIRIIQGDGVDFETIPQILETMKTACFAADNLAFGSGGALLQKVNRDTFKCAFKCSEITINGEKREVFKDPITDSGKASKKGTLTLQKAEDFAGAADADKYVPRQGDDGVQGGTGFLHFTPDGKFVTVASGKGDESKDILVEVYKDGVLLKDWTLDEIRKKADVPNGPFSQG
jgi:nicotinamide phosphoribosyltransferase